MYSTKINPASDTLTGFISIHFIIPKPKFIHLQMHLIISKQCRLVKEIIITVYNSLRKASLDYAFFLHFD